MLVAGHPPLAPRRRRGARPGPGEPWSREVDRQFRFVRRALSLHGTFMQIGSGDYALSRRVAGYAERVYAVGGPETAQPAAAPLGNLVPVLSDGVIIPVPERSVDVAFSHQFLERLHPRDALEHLKSVRRALAPGGTYYCITRNRLCAPWPQANEFRYTARELRELFLRGGFRAMRCRAGARGRYLRLPYPLLALGEFLIERLPYRVQSALGEHVLARPFLGLYVLAR